MDGRKSKTREWLTPQQAQRVLQVSRSTLHRLLRETDLPHVRIAKRIVRIPKQDFYRWLDQHREDTDEFQ